MDSVVLVFSKDKCNTLIRVDDNALVDFVRGKIEPMKDFIESSYDIISNIGIEREYIDLKFIMYECHSSVGDTGSSYALAGVLNNDINVSDGYKWVSVQDLNPFAFNSVGGGMNLVLLNKALEILKIER